MPLRGSLSRDPLFDADFKDMLNRRLAAIQEVKYGNGAIEGVDYPAPGQIAATPRPRRAPEAPLKSESDPGGRPITEEDLASLRERALGGSMGAAALLGKAEGVKAGQLADESSAIVEGGLDRADNYSTHADAVTARMGRLAQPVRVRELDGRPGQDFVVFKSPRDGKEFTLPRSLFGAEPGARAYAGKRIAGHDDEITLAEQRAAARTPAGYVRYLGPIDTQGERGPGPRSSYYAGPTSQVTGHRKTAMIPIDDKKGAAEERQRLRDFGYGILPGPTKQEMDLRDDHDLELEAAMAQLRAYSNPEASAFARVRKARQEAGSRTADYTLLAAAPFSPPTKR